jgi:hypothetical protein
VSGHRRQPALKAKCSRCTASIRPSEALAERIQDLSLILFIIAGRLPEGLQREAPSLLCWPVAAIEKGRERGLCGLCATNPANHKGPLTRVLLEWIAAPGLGQMSRPMSVNYGEAAELAQRLAPLERPLLSEALLASVELLRRDAERQRATEGAEVRPAAA